jgi:hypothetical protein
MKKNELRIGNLVKGIGFNVYWTIEGVKDGAIFASGEWRKLSAFEPIPLTEEWLEMLGFEYNKFYQNFRIKAGDYFNSIKYFDGEWCYNNDQSDAGCYFVTTVQYVHELQNLYFAINKEELKNESQRSDSDK